MSEKPQARSATGYYAWIKRPISIRQGEEERLELEILVAHKRTRPTYGPERLQRDLSDNGIVVGVHRIKRIHRKPRLRCRQKRKPSDWTELFHDPVIATSFLDRLLHHSVVINMRCNSYTLRGKLGKEGVE